MERSASTLSHSSVHRVSFILSLRPSSFFQRHYLHSRIPDFMEEPVNDQTRALECPIASEVCPKITWVMPLLLANLISSSATRRPLSLTTFAPSSSAKRMFSWRAA